MRNDVTRRLAVLAILAFAGPAVAQALDDQQKNCLSPNFDLRIDACTAVIRSGKMQGEPLASVLGSRGIAYMETGQLDRAIQDFNDALVIKPGFAAVLLRRGVAYRRKGNRAAALADFDGAIRINPQSAEAYADRGGIYLDQGSDLDLAVVLNGPRGDFIATKLDMAGLAFDVLMETGLLVQVFPMWGDDLTHPERFANPVLIRNIAREGLRLG